MVSVKRELSEVLKNVLEVKNSRSKRLFQGRTVHDKDINQSGKCHDSTPVACVESGINY